MGEKILGALRSRKFLIAVAAGVVAFVRQYGLVDAHTADQLVQLASVLIAGIALEDAGQKVGLPPVNPASGTPSLGTILTGIVQAEVGK